MNVTFNYITIDLSFGIPSQLSTVAMLFPGSPVFSDVIATGLTLAMALSILYFFEQTSNRKIFDSKLNRKLLHIIIGLVFMLCWPMFSEGWRGSLLASSVIGINGVKVLLIGLQLLKDEATVKSMSRFGDYRELLKGPLYYAASITFACAVYWRNSPIAIAAVCNLCAGDGVADIFGRHFGGPKLTYNPNKTAPGTISMAIAGFISSIGFMLYFSSFGYMIASWKMVWGFLIVTIASTLVESHPLSTDIDDNLTVPLTSFLVGNLVF